MYYEPVLFSVLFDVYMQGRVGSRLTFFFDVTFRYNIAGLLEHALVHGRVREAKYLVNMLHKTHPRSPLKKKWNSVVAKGEHNEEGGLVLFTARGLGLREEVLKNVC